MEYKPSRNKKNSGGYLMAVDLGTSTVKVAIYNLLLEEIVFKSEEYDLSYPGEDLVENDVQKYWETVAGLIRSAIVGMDEDSSSILAVSLSSQGETIVPLDPNMIPIRPAIVWLDGRSEEEAAQIARDFSIDKLFKITGMPFSDPSWPAARIMWFKNKETETFRAADKFLLLEDYIIYKLTEKIIGESTVYNTSYYYDIVKLKYYEPMLNYLGISESSLPEILPPGTVIGTISKKASLETGLSTSTRFVLGAMDQITGALGAGNIKNGVVTETTGTAFAMAVTVNEPVFDLKTRIPLQLHVETGKYCLLPYSTGGVVFKWFKDNFYNIEATGSGNIEIYDLMVSDASKVKPGCDGLIALPYLSGAFIPVNNPKARGVFFGVGLNHNKSSFVRAILESIGYMLRDNIEMFESSGIGINKIISLGGGAKSDLWCQIKSDITGIEINRPQYMETPLLGAAMIAGKGIGIYSEFKDIIKKNIKIYKVFQPNHENNDIYNIAFKKYKDIYKNLEKLF